MVASPSLFGEGAKILTSTVNGGPTRKPNRQYGQNSGSAKWTKPCQCACRAVEASLSFSTGRSHNVSIMLTASKLDEMGQTGNERYNTREIQTT